MVPAMRPNAEHAIHRAYRATDTRAYRTTDNSADRAGRTAALARALLSAADDALRVPGMRDRQ